MGSATADSRSGIKLFEACINSNLRSFLHSVTPTLEPYTVAKPGGYSGRVPELGRCFFLVDLWNHFYPLSAYGVGTPVRLPSGQEIEQYFVPYLSAIQLHTISDFTSCNEIMVGNNLFDANNYGWCSAADNWNGQYATTSLARYDSPRYPIGHVPAMNKKDLTTCFLTYHSLSTLEDRTPFDSKDPLTLPPIGLATHKTDGDVWTSANSGDQELTTSLVGAADSWLKKLDVQHHDFNYFLNSNRNLIHYRSLTEASTSAV
uniref:Uncharacterized protein n=1 Tax=Oryza rufipogon TaxID=4529 RepID=A0A0E0PBT8_ORYRU